MKKILITGGSGFLGGHLLKKTTLSRKRWNIYTTFLNRHIDLKDVHCFQCDLVREENVKNLFDKYEPDVVIHTAALTNIDRCEQNPEKAGKINIESTKFIADQCEQNNSRLIFVSTDMVFDGVKGNYSENDPPNPIHIYGNTKQKGENLVAEICSNYVIVRAALIYGLPFLGGSSFYAGMIESWGKHQKVTLFKNEYRTPISVTNLAMILVELSENQFNGILHCGGKERLSRYDFGLKLANHIGISDDSIIVGRNTDEVQLNTNRPKDLSLNSTKLLLEMKTSLLSMQEGINLEFKM